MKTVEQRIIELLDNPVIPHTRGVYTSAVFERGQLFLETTSNGFRLLPAYRIGRTLIRCSLWERLRGLSRCVGTGDAEARYYSDTITSNACALAMALANSPEHLIQMLQAREFTLVGEDTLQAVPALDTCIKNSTLNAWVPGWRELGDYHWPAASLMEPYLESPEEPAQVKYPFIQFVEELMRAGCCNTDPRRQRQKGLLSENGDSVAYVSRSLVRNRAGCPTDVGNYVLWTPRADRADVGERLFEERVSLTHDEKADLLLLLKGSKREILIGGALLRLEHPIGLYTESSLAE